MFGVFLIAFIAWIAIVLFLWVVIGADELGGIFLGIGIVGMILISTLLVTGVRHKLDANCKGPQQVITSEIAKQNLKLDLNVNK